MTKFSDIPPQLMQGKRGLVMGVANNHSIAWGIACAIEAAGGSIAYTYQNESILRRLNKLTDSKLLYPCDVDNRGDIEKVMAALTKEWPEGIDFVVHAIAFSEKNELMGRYIDTSRDNFLKSLDISCFSFTEIAKLTEPLLRDQASMLTMTYEGSRRTMPNYNVMGIAKAALESSVRYLAQDLGQKNVRVNAISAGPMRTLAGAAIGGARATYHWQGQHSALGQNITLEHVGAAGVYLLSDLSSSVTGEIMFVDAGYNITGMANPLNHA